MFSKLNYKFHKWFLSYEAYITWKLLKENPKEWRIESSYLIHKPSFQQFFIGRGAHKFNAVISGHFEDEHSIIGGIDRYIIWGTVKKMINEKNKCSAIDNKNKYYREFKLGHPNKR